MTTEVRAARVDADALRGQIRDKYTDVALTPESTWASGTCAGDGR